MLSESDRCLKMVAAALEDEEKGIALYENAVAVCNLELATEIFQMLLAQNGTTLSDSRPFTVLFKVERLGRIYGSTRR